MLKQISFLEDKKTVSVYITEYAKITLTERANKLGLNLSNYLELLARQPTKGGSNEKIRN